MSEKLTLFYKKDCPFCVKVLLAITANRVTNNFNYVEKQDVPSQHRPHIATYPTLLKNNEYTNESDIIVELLKKDKFLKTINYYYNTEDLEFLNKELIRDWIESIEFLYLSQFHSAMVNEPDLKHKLNPHVSEAKPNQKLAEVEKYILKREKELNTIEDLREDDFIIAAGLGVGVGRTSRKLFGLIITEGVTRYLSKVLKMIKEETGVEIKLA